MNIIDFFNKVYSQIVNKSPFLIKIKYYSAQRFFVRTVANFLLSIYFRLTWNSPDYCLKKCDKKTGRVIVSFTSFPKRINSVWIVVETILRQIHRPDKLILWLSKEQFPALDTLPKKLLKQQKRGLEIVLVDGDIRSHKKYYYAMKVYPEDYIITIDDDIIYRSTIIRKLVETAKNAPGYICSCILSLPVYNNGIIEHYLKWVRSDKTSINYEKKRYFFLTGSGTFYPPHSLYTDISNIELALKLCPIADDVWLNTMARLKGTRSVLVPGFDGFLPVQYLSNITLDSVNNGNVSQNDIQIGNVRRYYTEKLGIDPYKEM